MWSYDLCFSCIVISKCNNKLIIIIINNNNNVMCHVVFPTSNYLSNVFTGTCSTKYKIQGYYSIYTINPVCFIFVCFKMKQASQLHKLQRGHAKG